MAGDHDVRVRMPGVEMIGGHPVELGVEVVFHLRHQIAHEGFEVAHASAVLGRDNETELIGVALLALQEPAAIGLVVLAVVELAGAASAGDAVALDIVQVRAGGAEIGGAMTGDARLDDDAAPTGRCWRQSIERALATRQLDDRPACERIGPGRLRGAIARCGLDDDARQSAVLVGGPGTGAD